MVEQSQTDRELLSLHGEVTADHLSGTISVGLYPLMGDDSCFLLVCDFDGAGWTLDALAYLDAARAAGIPAVLERSRSGDGGHVWAFFSERVPASSARRIGAYLLREAMTARAEMDLVSYDGFSRPRTFYRGRASATSLLSRFRANVATRGRPYSSTHRRWALPGPMGVLGVCRPPESRGALALAESLAMCQ